MKTYSVNLLVTGIGKVPVTVVAASELDAVRTALRVVRATTTADAVAVVTKEGGAA